MTRTMRRMRKVLLVVACVALVAGLAIGGTLAYIVANTDDVTNTFTVGDINITLTETTGGEDKNYNFVPGDKIAKDPTVGVTKNSEACYLFIKVTETNNIVSGLTGKVINWTVDRETWKVVPEHEGFWYKEVTAEQAKAGSTFNVFTDDIDDDDKDGSVTVNADVTKTMVSGLTTNRPTITIDAAAVQSANIDTVADAWSQLPTNFTGATTGA